MARTNSADVKNILDTTVEDAKINAFINSANLMVTKYLGSETELSAAQKKDIEMWLTAHLIAATLERQVQEEQVDDAQIKHQGKTGLGLDSTFYGQTVKMLDTTGILSSKLGKKQASVYAIPGWND